MAAEPSTMVQSKRRPSPDAHDEPSSNRKRINFDEDTEEAITKEEMEGIKSPTTASLQPPTKPRNAFSELMSSKTKPAKPKAAEAYSHRPHRHGNKSSSFRDNLGIYLTNPSSFSSSGQIIFYTDSFVALHDLYPKATVHCLLLPRSPEVNRLHPFDALSPAAPEGPNAAFLASVRIEAARLQALVAKDLQRRLGRFSASEAPRNAILDGDGDGGGQLELDAEGNAILPPAGRDWTKDVKIGVHAVPSMNHLHIHVLSRDMHSDKMKHKKHYNSFTTDFFVPLEDFPLAADDWRRKRGAQRQWPERPMVCWRCGRDFGNRFKELKKHLEVEFEEWKRE